MHNYADPIKVSFPENIDEKMRQDAIKKSLKLRQLIRMIVSEYYHNQNGGS